MYWQKEIDVYKPSRYVRRCWSKALKAAGLANRKVHDFRRSGVRRIAASGVPDVVGMLISGHRSLNIYNNYKSTNDADLKRETQQYYEWRQSQRENGGLEKGKVSIKFGSKK